MRGWNHSVSGARRTEKSKPAKKIMIVTGLMMSLCFAGGAVMPQNSFLTNLSGAMTARAAEAGTFSRFWRQDASGNWKVVRPDGSVVANAWLCDDAVAANGKDVWYLLDANGNMISAGLVLDRTGNYYSLETNHNGYFGMLRYRSGSYDGISLTLDGSHNGSFAAVLNADGLEQLKGKYGVTQVSIDNSNIVYTSAFTASASVTDGWYENGGYRRYRLNGNDLKGKWRTIDGGRYYFDYNGNMVTGFQEIDGERYYFNEDGDLQKETFLLDGICYVINGDKGIIADEIYEEDMYAYSPNTYGAGSGSGYSGSTLTDREAYAKITAMKSDYPEGMRWTNDNSYSRGSYTGYGCAGFAFLVQDTVFGKGSSRTVNELNWSDIRVGDHLRIDYDTHSVIVLSVGEDSVTVCEGNYNSSIHWGRKISRSDVEDTFAYLETRY